MEKNDVILMVIMFVITIGFYLLNPDFMRYEAAINPNTGKPCYIKDYKTGKELQVTDELMKKIDGSFYCDPSLCE